MKKPPLKSNQSVLLEGFIEDLLDDSNAEEPSFKHLANEAKTLKPQLNQKTDLAELPSSNLASKPENRLDSSYESPKLHRQSNPNVSYDLKKENIPDERLEKVKNLLANMPLTKPISVVNETEVTDKKPEVKFEPLVKVQPQPEQQKVLPPDSAPLELKQVKVEDIQEKEEDELSKELVEEDVSRAVIHAKQSLGDNFQTLVFDIGKLSLAVPLVKLGGIHAYSEHDLTPLFGSPDWFMGILPSDHGNILLVDTAKFIMPDQYLKIEGSLDYKYAILLDDTRWALACTHVREAKSLSLDDIRWTQKNSKKEWLAGMVVEYMCALLEVDSLINMLYRQRNQQKSR